MSESGEIEVEAVVSFKSLPKAVVEEVGTIKLLYEEHVRPLGVEAVGRLWQRQIG